MNYTNLGRTGLKVSRLCLGTMNFGWMIGEQESFAIMDRALDLGVNFFDTADVYGFDKGNGVTEEILGRWLAQGGGRREAIVLATKVYGGMKRPDARPEPNQSEKGLSALKIIRGCEQSLRRLRVEAIDLYQMHHIDRHCPAEEALDALETLQRQGKVIYIGSSNFAGWDIATFNQVAARRGRLGLVSEQSLYNLLARTLELEVIPACRHYGLGLIPWSPLQGGLLAGALHKASEGRRAQKGADRRVQEHRAKLEPWEALCGELGEKPADVALAWLLRNPVVAATIIGPRTIGQLEGALRSLELALSADTLKRIDAIFPGPGGEAPNAYAW